MSLQSRLDATVARALDEKRIVGGVLIVKQHGETIYEHAYGLADREAGRAMTVDAIFRLSSLTKPIVAASILALVDRGRLRLDDPITKYLPYFRPKMEDGSEPAITIHQLLTHTSGVNSLGWENSAEEDATGKNRWHYGNEDMLLRLARAPLLFKPGSDWAYGASLDVLGVLAATLTGGTLDEALRELVTGPLGMVDTGFSLSDPKRLAGAYADGSDGPVLMGNPHTVHAPWGGTVVYDPGRILDPQAFQAGGGGMAGTGRDFMALLEALRGGGAPILSRAITDIGLSLQTHQLAFAQNPGWDFSYFGVRLADPELAESPAPEGFVRWGGIYGHNWFIDPVNGYSVVSMSNTGLEGCDGPFKDEVRNAVYGAG